MPLLDSVSSEAERIDRLVTTLDTTVDSVDPIIQNLYANQVVLAAAGYVENATKHILSEYAQRYGDKAISRYIEHAVSRKNSLSCAKIKDILDCFNNEWWLELNRETSDQRKSAVNSLKTLRDAIAHGKHNGTGYTTVKTYYSECKKFVADMCDVILPS